MKSEIRSAKSWANYLSQNPNYKIESLIADAQRNALEFATAICREQLEPRLGEDEDYSNGHANRGVSNCEEAIREAIQAIK